MKTMISIEAFKKYLPLIIEEEQHLAFRRGQIVFYEGHKPYGLYVVHSGRVGLFANQGSSKDVEAQKLVGPGEILNEEILLKGEFYPHTARAVEDTQVIFFPRSIFDLPHAAGDSEGSECDAAPGK